jgi:hypothetical protein
MSRFLGILGEGRVVQVVAVGAAAVVLGTMAIGGVADRYARSGDFPLLAAIMPHDEPTGGHNAGFNAIDYATTGSITGKSQLVVIGPCGPTQTSQ